MGSHPTLDHHPLAADTRQPDPDHWPHRDAVAHPAAEHAFDRLNPDFGVPADHHNPYGRQAVRDREAALALGAC